MHFLRRNSGGPGTFFWIVLVLFPLLFLLICASDSFSGNFSDKQNFSVKKIIDQKDSITSITISFIGDLMCHVPQITNAKQADGTYDFNPSFKEITPFLSASDLTMGNLECTFAGTGRPYGGYPAFNSPDDYLKAIKNAGIDFLCTANNHCMDTGEEGLQRTLKKVRENNFGSTGTFSSQRDRDSIRVLNIKGMNVAILNYTYGTNGAYPSADHKWMMNVADSALVHDDVVRARKTNADIVLVFYHWGIENKQEPIAKQDSMFHWAADAGADLVIGAHPHVLEPLAFYKTATNAKLDSGLVAWSLGNFLSNQYWRYTDAGVILTVTLQKNFTTGKISLEKTSYVPTWVYRSYDPSLMQHVVMPAFWCGNDSLPEWIKADSKTKMCEAYYDTKAVLTKYSKKPVLQTQAKNDIQEALKQFMANKNKGVPPGDSIKVGDRYSSDTSGAQIRISYLPDHKGACERYIISKPAPYVNQTGEEGTIETLVKIDREGNVVDVSKGTKSTSSSNTLFAIARQQSFQLKFNKISDCSDFTIVSVMVEFQLK